MIKPRQTQSRMMIVAVAVLVIVNLPARAYAQCPYKLPNTLVAHDLKQVGTLGYTKAVRIINVYWGGSNWDAIPAHKPVDPVHYGFRRADIDLAMTALFSTI